MRLDQYEKQFEERPERTAFNLTLKIGLGIAALVVVFSIVGGVIHTVTNPAVQAGRIVDKTIDADNVIYNYEWFHRQYGDLQAMTPKLDNAQATLDQFIASAGPRDKWQFDDRQEYSRLSSIVLGLHADGYG